ncbi:MULTISPECIES: Flp family type IVb pilin [unclassified Nocardioides]|uniref:Flp family type IVb pilin n=1 Tax=unclassified Nocardioides TaxID=2615069 RepID=UPI00362145F7
MNSRNGRNEPARRRSERGASAVEYGLLVSLVAAVIGGVVLVLGVAVTDLFDSIPDPW